MAYAAFLFIVLSTVAFFNYHAILSESASKALFCLSVLIGGVVAAFYARGERRVSYPLAPWLMLMGGLLVSVFMATLYHQQSLKVSFVTTLPVLLSYATFVIFMRFDLPAEKVMRTYLVLAVVSAIVYFCNVLTVPNNMFGKPMLDIDDSRGIVRIYVIFLEMFSIMIFYVINRWLVDKKFKWVILGSFLLVMVVLSVIRQVIVYTVLLSALFIMRRVSWKIKALICGACVAIVVFVLPMIPVYKALVELSEEQVDDNEEKEDIRITAWRFYTYDNQTGDLTPILGNGMPSFGNSVWGIAFDAETQDNGCFFVDVGWAGLYWLHGIFAVIGLLWLMGAALMRKKPENMQFVNYGIVYFFLLCFASGPNLYYFQIVSLMLLLSMAFSCAPQTDALPAASMVEKRPRLLPRFPQLR